MARRFGRRAQTPGSVNPATRMPIGAVSARQVGASARAISRAAAHNRKLAIASGKAGFGRSRPTDIFKPKPGEIGTQTRDGKPVHRKIDPETGGLWNMGDPRAVDRRKDAGKERIKHATTLNHCNPTFVDYEVDFAPVLRAKYGSQGRFSYS